jgi:hypothetical protein
MKRSWISLQSKEPQGKFFHTVAGCASAPCGARVVLLRRQALQKGHLCSRMLAQSFLPTELRSAACVQWCGHSALRQLEHWRAMPPASAQGTPGLLPRTVHDMSLIILPPNRYYCQAYPQSARTQGARAVCSGSPETGCHIVRRCARLDGARKQHSSYFQD